MLTYTYMYILHTCIYNMYIQTHLSLSDACPVEEPHAFLEGAFLEEAPHAPSWGASLEGAFQEGASYSAVGHPLEK